MKMIYCYGDSNTWGYDSRSFFGERYPKHIRWTGILDENTDFSVINDGMNGRMIPQSSVQIEALAESIETFLLSADEIQLWIMLGVNDLLNHPADGAEYAAGKMKCFLDKLLSFPAMKRESIFVRLIAPPLLKRGSWVGTDDIVRESCLLADSFQRAVNDMDIKFTDASVFDIPLLSDGVHFSEEGHRNFADSMISVLKI